MSLSQIKVNDRLISVIENNLNDNSEELIKNRFVKLYIDEIKILNTPTKFEYVDIVYSNGAVRNDLLNSFNGYVIYVPENITQINYRGITLENVQSPVIFVHYPIIGDVALRALNVDNDNKIIDLVTNETGVYMLVSVRLSLQTQNYAEFYTKKYLDNNDIEEIETTLNNSIDLKIENALTQTINIDFSESIEGYFIVYDGSLSINSSWAYLTNIEVYKGDKIILQATGYGTNVCMIGKKLNESSFEPKVISIDYNNREYIWYADEDCIIGISYKIEDVHSLKILRNNLDVLTNIENNVKELKEDVNNIQNNNIKFHNLFPRIAVIGDSLASGQLENPSGEPYSFGDIYGQSWISCIARMTNAISRTHYSEARLTCQGWLYLHSEVWGTPSTNYLEKMQSDEPFNAYFIALGTNDISRASRSDEFYYPLGDITDSAGNVSFIGYYKQIIEALRTKAPHSVIFCLSMYNNLSAPYIAYSNAVEQICDLYDNTFFVDFANNSEIQQWSSTGTVRFHFSTWGYNYIANIILDLVNKICYDNPEFFKLWGVYNSIGEKYNL